MLYLYPAGFCGKGVHNPQKFRIRVMDAIGNLQEFQMRAQVSCKTYKPFAYEILWHLRTELTEVPRRKKQYVPAPRVLWRESTALTEVRYSDVGVVHSS